MKRVVITGIGIYSTIGKNLEEVKDSLYHGRSGIGMDQERIKFGYRSGLTGIIERPQLKGLLDRRTRVCMAEQGEYAYMATREALAGAKIDDDFLENNEVGIIYGNDSSATPVINAIDVVREKKDTQMMGSGAIFQSMNSTITMNLSVIYKLKGINYTISAACASGSHAVGMAYMLIKNGYQSHVIAGGGQEVNIYSMGSFDALSAFSVNMEDPTKASRPFDKSRDGLVPSGGGASLVLEDYDLAVKRGAPILAEIVGYGFSSDGVHISQPTVSGPLRAMRKAFQEADIDLKTIDYINAHATSTPVGDMNEAKAIREVFGDKTPLISSTKSMTGHEMWMGGASELIYSILMMKNSFVAPNINFENPDEYSQYLNIAKETTPHNIDLFMSNSFGFGGTNSTILVKNL